MENGLVVTGVDLGTDSTLMTLERLVKDVLAGLSEHTRRVYAPHIKRFVQNGYQLNREGLQRWIGDERDKRKTPAAINQGISAVKKLAEECGERGLIGAVEWGGVRSVKRLKQRGVRVGNWLTIEEVELVLNGTTSRRDKALLSLLLGCGLRRDEAAQLRRRHVQVREGRMVLVDIVGKGQRVRSVTVPDWAAEPLTKFMDLATADQKDDEDGFVFRLSESGVWWVVKETCGRVLKKNRTIAPHDLRRTYARLSVEGKADMRQLQAELGHSSIQTTERYVGAGQKFGKGQGAGDAIAIGKKK